MNIRPLEDQDMHEHRKMANIFRPGGYNWTAAYTFQLCIYLGRIRIRVSIQSELSLFHPIWIIAVCNMTNM